MNYGNCWGNCWLQFWSNRTTGYSKKVVKKEDKDYTGVTRPALIGSNNKSMSGTDETGQALFTYQPFVHNIMWYWQLFLYYLEVSLYNSWLLYCISEKDCPSLEHVQSIANSYLNLHQSDRRVFKTEEIMFKNSHFAKRVDPAVRFDRKNYLLVPDPTKMCTVWQKVPNVELNYITGLTDLYFE